jgi:AraC-like DNA-binding protein
MGKENKQSIWKELWLEYKSELIFGVVLGIIVVASYRLAAFIPEDIFERFINPSENIATIVVCLYGAWMLSRHLEGNRLRQSWMWVLLIWAAIISVSLVLRYGYKMMAVGGTPGDPLYNASLTLGNLLACLLFIYPSQVLRPEWLTWRKVFGLVAPMVIVGIIDYFLPANLIYLIMLYPAIIFVLLLMHVRKYRRWCEKHYSSMDKIDAQWVVKYLIILLLIGVSFYFIGFWYIPNRLFTQQWMLLFILAYSTEKILFRPDPWSEVVLNDEGGQVSSTNVSSSKEDSQTPSNGEVFKEERAVFEAWMEKEKPYLNPDFQLMDLRQVLPTNRTYLSQFINTEYGCNFYQLVSRYRIEEAKQLMRQNPSMKMQEVAANSGFSSPTVFGRVFARETGMTPTEWSSQCDNIYASEGSA